MEEKNCRDRVCQLFLSASPPFFFLQHSSVDSLDKLFLPAAAAERKSRNVPARTTASIAIRMVFLLLMVVDFFI